MKLRVIGLMAILFAGSVAAEEVHLMCSGEHTNYSEESGYTTMTIRREVKFDEDDQTLSWKHAPNSSWKSGKDVQISEERIVATVKPGFAALGQTIEVSIDRYTGLARLDMVIDQTLQCKPLSRTERAF